MQIISFLNKITLNRATLRSYIIYQYVDDTNLIELIPRNSPSYLPIAATVRNIIDMHRNAKKCKEMTVDFLQYKPTVLSLLHVGGSLIERVSDPLIKFWVSSLPITYHGTNIVITYTARSIRDSLASEYQKEWVASS